MTVIAWDGKTLAADKRGTNNGMRYTVTKIHRVQDGLIALAGGSSHAMALLHWFRSDRNPSAYPVRDEESGADTIHIGLDGQVSLYGSDGPYPELVESPFYARGSGRAYAMAAMHLGLDAKRAVEVACAFEISCGDGIDTLTL